MKTIGLDVGGANIKLANTTAYCRHQPFALWQRPQELTDQLRELLVQAPAADQIALTMTGELTDCFATKQEGVEFIIDSACAATKLPVLVYLIGNRFVDADQAKQQYPLAAASNWLALATWIARRHNPVTEPGLLVDIGSTTTDIIPLLNGHCVAAGQTDFERLVNHELVYTGVVRSPICGIVDELEFRGDECPVMNELFATALDAHVVLGNLQPGSCPEYAADSCGTHVSDCVTRLARMVGRDHSLMTVDDATNLARQIVSAQVNRLLLALDRVIARSGMPKYAVVSGQGEFLAADVVHEWCRSRQCTDLDVLCLSRRLDAESSSCATAVATAWLLENCGESHSGTRQAVVTDRI